MAVFEYQCAAGHVSERFVKLAEKPAEILCDHIDCDFMAQPITSAVKTTFRCMDRTAFKRRNR